MKKAQKFIACFVLMMSIASLGFAQNIEKGTDKKGKLTLEKKGKAVVKEKFEKIGSYDNKAGLIPAKLNGKWGFYDNDGKLMIAHQYDALFCSTSLDDWYVQERITVGLNGKKMYIDKTGKEISAPEYEDVVKVGQGVDAYYLKKNGKFALADKDKKPLTEYVYLIIQLKSLDPVTYTGVRDGKPYQLSANGEEMGEAASTSSSSNSSSNNTKKIDKHKYTCDGCGATEIMEGLSKRPSPNKTHCPSPKVKNSTSHSWDYTGKVK